MPSLPDSENPEIAELRARQNREFDAMFAPLGAGAPSAPRPTATKPAIIPRRPRTWRCHKTPYHHGSLAEAAVNRGLEIVAQRGPMGLTLRGLARDLGVSPAAINYYFHNRAGLRAAVANAAAEQMRPFSVFRAGGLRAASTLRDNATAWVNYAATNPELYRIVFGEGWRGSEPKTLPRGQCLHSIDRVANIGQMSGHVHPGNTQDHGWFLWSAMHGLAQSCADGVTSPQRVAPLIDRFVASVAVHPAERLSRRR